MEFQNLGKIIIYTVLFLVVFGLLLALSPKIPFLGKLPGDFVIKRDNYTIYLPLASSVLISAILSLVLSFILRGR